jgi:hypothetical protein
MRICEDLSLLYTFLGKLVDVFWSVGVESCKKLQKSKKGILATRARIPRDIMILY